MKAFPERERERGGVTCSGPEKQRLPQSLDFLFVVAQECLFPEILVDLKVWVQR